MEDEASIHAGDAPDRKGETVITAITGTPGTGKKSVAYLLRERGMSTLSVEELARDHGILEGDEIDISKLHAVSETLSRSKDLYIFGHLSHYTRWDRAFVLRCSPDVLYERLIARGWKREKVIENVRSEILDIILCEAVQEGEDVFQIDTTHLKPEQAAEAIMNEASPLRKRPGSISWFNEVLDWF